MYQHLFSFIEYLDQNDLKENKNLKIFNKHDTIFNEEGVFNCFVGNLLVR